MFVFLFLFLLFFFFFFFFVLFFVCLCFFFFSFFFYYGITKLSIFAALSFRKHAYSTILKILPPKNENFQIKNPDIFHISAQNIDCGYALELPRRGGSNEYLQSMF